MHWHVHSASQSSVNLSCLTPRKTANQPARPQLRLPPFVLAEKGVAHFTGEGEQIKERYVRLAKARPEVGAERWGGAPEHVACPQQACLGK